MQLPIEGSAFLKRVARFCKIEQSAEMPPFAGGWVGFISYDAGGVGAKSDSSFPKASLGLFNTVLAYSHHDNIWRATVTDFANISARGRHENAAQKVRSLLAQISPVSECGGTDFQPERRLAHSDFTRIDYVRAVERALAYISVGDIYQINLAQRFTTRWEHSAEKLYLRLRAQSPAEYGAFLGEDLVGAKSALCSISPELFLRLRGKSVITRPIKGTRALGSSVTEMKEAKQALNQSAKERAELNMIVDLERNDLGRVCEYGSVKVESAGDIEELPTLLHRVATVSGVLKKRHRAYSLLKSAFPGGSVTGAPKIRAMQIIHELERSARGPYCGGIGWIGLNGDMEFNIAIRTALYDGASGTVHYHAGSGIVADSIPDREYDETLQKAAAFFRAVNAELKTE